MTYRMHKMAYRSSEQPSMFKIMHGEQGSAHHSGRGEAPRGTYKAPTGVRPLPAQHPGMQVAYPGAHPKPRYPGSQTSPSRPNMSYDDQKRLEIMGYSMHNPDLAKHFKTHFNNVAKTTSRLGRRRLRVDNSWSREDSNALSDAYDWARRMPRDWMHYAKKSSEATPSRGGRPVPPSPRPLPRPAPETKLKKRRSRRARRSIFKR